jgi:hypothetical protein
MRRCVSRVERNVLVVGVDVFYCISLFVYFLWRDIVRSKRSMPTLRDLVRETGSALDVWLAPHMWLVDASFSHYSCHVIYTGCWKP